jgi:hypothetical protein
MKIPDMVVVNIREPAPPRDGAQVGLDYADGYKTAAIEIKEVEASHVQAKQRGVRPVFCGGSTPKLYNIPCTVWFDATGLHHQFARAKRGRARHRLISFLYPYRRRIVLELGCCSHF